MCLKHKTLDDELLSHLHVAELSRGEGTRCDVCRSMRFAQTLPVVHRVARSAPRVCPWSNEQ